MTASVSPDLEFDAATHTYTRAGIVIPSTTQILESSGISDFSMVPPETLKHAQERGTAVHAACHYNDEGDLDESSLDPEVRPYLEAWRLFLRETGAKILAIETRFYSPVGYAGMFDRLLDFPKWGRTMADMKTGAECASWAPQLAAYSRGVFGIGARGVRRMNVKLSKDGHYKMIWHEERTETRDWNVFAGALTVWNYRKEHGLL